MSLDRSDFIQKAHGRKFFRCWCPICGQDKGYKMPESADRPCYSCNSKKANLCSLIARGCNLTKRVFSTVCKECGITFIRSGNHRYCSVLCKKQYISKYRKQIDNTPKAKQYRVKYNQTNRARLTQNHLNKMHSSVQYKLSTNLRGRLVRALKRHQRHGSAIRDLGCSVTQLKIYLQLQFRRRPKDSRQIMDWNNWGQYGWHIDHIIPLASFDLTDPEQLKKACHYTNLQPLWAEENYKKGDSL